MKITNSNIAYVAYLLRKTISNGFTIQYFYPEAKKKNSILKHFNVENYFLYSIDESNVAEFQNVSIELDELVDFGKFIRIHNNGGYSRNTKATIIKIGDEIKFNKNLITLRAEFMMHDAKCIKKIRYV